MAEILLGDLSQAKFFDILKPLLAGKKDGKLIIKGKNEGSVYLEEGNIVHARAGSSSGEDAFDTIMGWRSGKCTFETETSPEDRTILIPTEQLLLNWSYRKQEWEKIRKVLPSSGVVFRISLQNDPGDKNIKAEHWNVLALANGMRTVGEIAESLGWDEFKVSRAVFQLLQAGLLEKAEGQKAAPPKGIGESFFAALEFELKKVMGPVAPFIIEDKLSEFQETKESFPQDLTEAFLQSLAGEIPHEQKRKEFFRIMMDFLPGVKARGGSSRLPGIELKI